MLYFSGISSVTFESEDGQAKSALYQNFLFSLTMKCKKAHLKRFCNQFLLLVGSLYFITLHKLGFCGIFLLIFHREAYPEKDLIHFQCVGQRQLVM